MHGLNPSRFRTTRKKSLGSRTKLKLRSRKRLISKPSFTLFIKTYLRSSSNLKSNSRSKRRFINV